jgi:hypothetical protein
MKCTECGGAMQTRKGVFKHKTIGLPNVTLAGERFRASFWRGAYHRFALGERPRTNGTGR